MIVILVHIKYKKKIDVAKSSYRKLSPDLSSFLSNDLYQNNSHLFHHNYSICCKISRTDKRDGQVEQLNIRYLKKFREFKLKQ